MKAIQGITFEKDASGTNRYMRIDLQQHAKALQPLMQMLGLISFPEGWNEGLTSEEFLMSTKKILRKKFDDRNQIS